MAQWCARCLAGERLYRCPATRRTQRTREETTCYAIQRHGIATHEKIALSEFARRKNARESAEKQTTGEIEMRIMRPPSAFTSRSDIYTTQLRA